MTKIRNILIVPDKFKGSLTAAGVADALETAARRGWVHATAHWHAAEDLRADLEARVAAGETLGADKSGVGVERQ